MRNHRGGFEVQIGQKIWEERLYGCLLVSEPGPAGQGSKKAFEPLAISFTQTITSSFTTIFSFLANKNGM